MFEFNTKEEFKKVQKDYYKESDEIRKKIISLIDDEILKLSETTEYNFMIKLIIIYESISSLNIEIFYDKLKASKKEKKGKKGKNMKIKSLVSLVILSVVICLSVFYVKSYAYFYFDTSLQKHSVKIDGLKVNSYFDSYIRCNDRWAHIISNPTIISGIVINNSYYMLNGYFNVYADGQILKIEYLFPYNPWKNDAYNNSILLYLDSFGKLSQRAV